MLFDKVKEIVQTYLQGEDSGTYDVVNKYLTSIYADKERLARETHELLQLLRDGMLGKQPTSEASVRLGNVGTITMGLHYAYPLLVTVLGYWVGARVDLALTQNLNEEQRKALRTSIEKEIVYFDVHGLEVREGRHEYRLRKLFIPPKEEENPQVQPKLSLRQKVFSFLRF
jgi:hypothetical protein